MGKTTVELFRAGNRSSPRMENARPGADVTTYHNNGVEYVTARSGGVSTYETKDPTLNGTWHRLAAGSDYDDNALAALNGKFTLAP
jgi:hypothetical protein